MNSADVVTANGAEFSMRLKIGMPVHSTDEHWGELEDIVLDPKHWLVTNLILKPRFHYRGSWLVPIGAVAICGHRLGLSLSSDEVVACPQVGTGRSYDSSVSTVITTEFDQLPIGTVPIGHACEVVTSDNHEVGHVDGLVVGADDNITHLVLRPGHRWGHRGMAIPLADVAEANREVVRLGVNGETVAAYPQIDFHDHVPPQEIDAEARQLP